MKPAKKSGGELQDLVVDLESAPISSPGRQRLVQRLQHLKVRILHLEPQILDPGKKDSILELSSSVEEMIRKQGADRPDLSDVDLLVPVDVAGTEGGLSAPLPASFGVGVATYQQLPNPLVGALKGFSEIDGLEEMRPIDFFLKIFHLSDFPGVTDHLVLQLVYPFCRGPMAELLTRITRQGGCLELFHAEALDAFLPGRLREQLRQKLFYLVQAHGRAR